jgi:hypothetical protein
MEIEITPKRIKFLIAIMMLGIFGFGYCVGYLVFAP